MTGATLVETHTAVVVAVGDRVYKAKKCVRLPFVDLSTRDARRRACEREVELNRRLSPDVYLGVARLAGAGDDEPVVVMRRMPGDRRLSFIVAARRSDAEPEIRRVARAVAGFHARAHRSAEVVLAAAPGAVAAAALRNIDELRDVAAPLLDLSDVAEARALTERYLAGREALLAERMAYARDGHGDLLAEDVFCLADGPRILDCLEFDDTLRYGDVLADVAFLAMDLERLGGTDAARTFLDAYAAYSGETWPRSLEDFYVAQRALVRAKVACIVAATDDGKRAEAHHLMTLALRHLRATRCRLVLVGGAPGTGKSTLAAHLADTFGMTLLRSDAIREHRVYGPEHVAATYAELLRRAETALAHGEPVVADATWLDPARRDEAAAVARRTAADLVELRCVTPVPLQRERVLARALSGHTDSDATRDVAERLAREAPPWPAALVVDTAQPVERSYATAAALLA